MPEPSTTPKARQRRGKYKLSESPVEIPRQWKVLFFLCLQLPAALLWVGNAVVNVVVIRYFWRSDSIFLCVAFGIGAAVHLLSAAGQALYLVLTDQAGVEAWLGFPARYLLIPPLTLLFPLFFPVWLWLLPYPSRTPAQYHTIEEEEEVVVTSVEPSLPSDCAPAPGPFEAPRRSESPYNAALPGVSRRARCESRGTETSDAEYHPPKSCGPPRTRKCESTTLPKRLGEFQAIQEVERTSLSAAYWCLLWRRYNTQIQFSSWEFDGHVNIWYLLGFAYGAMQTANDVAFNDPTYYLCVVGFLLKVVYMMFSFTMSYCSESVSMAYGLVRVALFLHDIASGSFLVFLCGSFGLSSFNSLSPAPGDAKDLHSLGLQGSAAFKAIQAFVWIHIGTACIGFVIGAIRFVFIAATTLSWTISVPLKICKVMGCFFIIIVVMPHLELIRVLAPSVMCRHLLHDEASRYSLDCGIILRLFHFITAHPDPGVRAKRVYFFVREQMCDWIDESWKARYERVLASGVHTGISNINRPKPAEEEESVDPVISKLFQVLSTRPFATTEIAKMYRPKSESWPDRLREAAEKRTFVAGFINLIFPFFFVPAPGSNWLMVALFVLKCISLVSILLLIPASISYRRFWLEAMIGDGPRFPTPVVREPQSLSAFRWIARYFATVDVASVAGAHVPVELLPVDISQRVGGFLHPDQFVVPPEVDGEQFEEEFAADPYYLPLWDGRMPNPDRQWAVRSGKPMND